MSECRFALNGVRFTTPNSNLPAQAIVSSNLTMDSNLVVMFYWVSSIIGSTKDSKSLRCGFKSYLARQINIHVVQLDRMIAYEAKDGDSSSPMGTK